MPEQVGLSTTIPVEVLLAAGVTPVDLNNVFITDERRDALVARAELDGYPQSACGWIKGIYAAVLERGIRRVVAVTQGDCSQTHAMMETLQAQGVEVIPFAYPYDRDRPLLRLQIERLAERFGTNWDAAEAMRGRLVSLRASLAELDRRTWDEGTVTGLENHTWLVSASDFSRDVEVFEAGLAKLLTEARGREPQGASAVRLGIIGVPPIITDFYEALPGLGVHVVYNEVQRQFAMIANPGCDLLEQYALYTYPYDVFGRIDDIRAEVARRRVDGLVHYVQSFCFRQIEDMLLKRGLPVPVLTIEGDKPAQLDARNRLRLEAFVETLVARRRVGNPSVTPTVSLRNSSADTP
jgi:benzoyl-CoA reductase/2-hydroxyglutaryl-CoA dehydratase subunit BcrC/BadD/HgdB